MRGMDARSGELFSYVDLEKRVPAKHALRLVRGVVNDVLAALDRDFSKAYADGGRPSIPPGHGKGGGCDDAHSRDRKRGAACGDVES
jgi:hypothetical protein